MKAIFKHEMRGFFHSLTAYIFCAALLVFIGIGAMMYNITASVANFEYVLQFVCIGMVVIVPVLTMRSISEEKKQKTDQLLYSLPLKTPQIVIGKYLAMLVVFAIPTAIMCFYPLVFSAYGDVYLPTSYGAIVAFFIMGAAMIAIGIFISSLTENQGIAAGIAIGLLLLNYFSVTLANYVSSTAIGGMIALIVIAVIVAIIAYFLTKSSNVAYGIVIVGIALVVIVNFADSSIFSELLPNMMSTISLFNRFSSFVNGVFDVTSIIFYATVIILFLFVTVQSLEKRRYN